MSFPLPPDPITWTSDQAVTAPALRADCTNLAWLLTKRPLLVCSQGTTAQSISSNTVTPVVFDSETVDNWNGHAIPNATYAAQTAGWYLAEGVNFFDSTLTGGYYAAGIQAVQNGVTSNLFCGVLCGNGQTDPGPGATDLVQLNPFTSDTVAMFAYQTATSAVTLATAGAYFDVQWAGLPTNLTGAGEGNVNGTVVSSPQPAALWPPGSGTLITNGGGIAAGATSMTVGETTGMVVGGSLGLDYYEGTAVSPMAETVTISSISSLTVGISATNYPHGGTTTPGYVAVPVSAAWMNQQVRDCINFLAYPPMARLCKSSQSISSQTFPAATVISFTTATLDNFSGWNGSNEWVVPVSGVYYIYGQVIMQPPTAAIDTSAGIGISGGTIQWGDSARCQASLLTSALVRKTLRLTAGQYVQLFVSQANVNGAVSLENVSNAYTTLVILWRGF